MDPLVVFLVSIVLITLLNVRFNMPPFFSLVAGAFCFGLLSGIDLNLLIMWIGDGIARIFAELGIIVISGVMISKLLIDQHYMDDIIAFLRSFARRPSVAAGLSGYLVTMIATCSVAGYMMVHPFVAEFERDASRQKALLYLVAVGGAVSYALIVPSPVVLALLRSLASTISAVSYLVYALPISVLLLGGAIWYVSRVHYASAAGLFDVPIPKAGYRISAFVPFLAIVAATPPVFFVFHLRSLAGIQVVMVIGALTALALAPRAIRTESFTKAARLSGLIVFDTCAAGGLGYVIINTPFSERAFTVLGPVVPILLMPFLFAATIQAAQGSRMVTGVVSGQVLAGSAFQAAIHPIPLILMIAAGSCLFSYVTDPQFWILQKTTGDDIRTVVTHYTLPLVVMGIVLFVIAAGLQIFVFR